MLSRYHLPQLSMREIVVTNAIKIPSQVHGFTYTASEHYDVVTSEHYDVVASGNWGIWLKAFFDIGLRDDQFYSIKFYKQ